MKLAGYTVGDGPRRAVLLHGFLGSSRNLRTFATEWSRRDPSRTLHALDLPGHGASPPIDERAPVTLSSFAAAVMETCPDATELVGHSLGGRVALAALRLPLAAAQITKITMIDISPSPIRDSDSGRVLDVLRRAPDREASRAVMRDWLVANGLSRPLAEWSVLNVSPDGAWKIDREALARAHELVNAEDLWDLVDGRTSCVRGARSTYVSDADAARLPTVTVDAGHYVHVDALAELVTFMTES
jgi:pimeloyl-ACP methyl ester carboxylesterase